MSTRLHRSPEETVRYHQEHSRRSMKRRYLVIGKALRWLKRNQPEVLKRLETEALPESSQPLPGADRA